MVKQASLRTYAASCLILVAVVVIATLVAITTRSTAILLILQAVVGIDLVALGVHLVLYRDTHSEFLKGRFGVVQYHPSVIAIVGAATSVIGALFATGSVVKLLEH